MLSSNPQLTSMVEEAGKKINLKKHRVGKVELAGPGNHKNGYCARVDLPLPRSTGDIEGHLGTDDRYYLLDFARTMPPEAPNVM